MSCELARTILHGYVDGELDAARREDEHADPRADGAAVPEWKDR